MTPLSAAAALYVESQGVTAWGKAPIWCWRLRRAHYCRRHESGPVSRVVIGSYYKSRFSVISFQDLRRWLMMSKQRCHGGLFTGVEESADKLPVASHEHTYRRGLLA